jgi:hypothetical protein
MLAQDPLTGYLHEVPDQLYGYGYAEYPDIGEAPVAYDGLGYPVGLPFLAPIAAAAGPLIAKAAGALAPAAARAVGGLIPQAGRLISGLVPQAAGLLRNLIPGGGGPVPGLPALPRLPGLPGFPPMPGLPVPRPYAPRPFCRAPQPIGWVTPALPYTGRLPRRMYLRCSVWPGPKGLVPAIANLPVPAVPGVPGMPVPAAAAAAAMAVGRRRRRRRR